MSYRPDPGGVFASDTHRRVLGHLPLPGDEPMQLHPLGRRISDDRFHELRSVDDLSTVIAELEADGHATSSDDGWVQTEAGLDALRAPPPEEPSGPVRPALLEGLESNAGSKA